MAHLSTTERGIMYLFERPYQPLYMPRANNGLVYNLPGNVVPDTVITTRFRKPGVTEINISEVTSVDQLPSSVRAVKRRRVFSHFIPTHSQAARDLLTLMMRINDVGDLLNFCANIRDGINEMLFIFVLSEAIIRKPQFRHIGIPSFVEVMASNFIPQSTMETVREQTALAEVAQERPQRLVIDHDQDFSGNDLNPEHRVAYWREDYGINAHHWHWHLVFPLRMGFQIDRKGEIFYYMHQQMLARYEMERLSNNLNRVQEITNLRAALPEGYFPKLNLSNAGANWGNRQDNTRLSSYRRQEFFEPFTITDLEIWRQRIFDAIHQGYFMNTQGERVTLSDDVDIMAGEKRGVDILGDTFEADTELSVNSRFYGDLHNFGHVMIAAAHDPDGSHNEELGVMSSPATAMRDPIFYRWHKFVDNVFQNYKLAQRPYQENELVVDGITVDKITVRTGTEENILKTFFDTISIEASRGIDFRTPMPVDVNLTRLNHEEFSYQIIAQNTSGSPKQVTVRIFLAPKLNEGGRDLDFNDQRVLWAEMDKFTHTLDPGRNEIIRKSTDSSITIPEELSFNQIEAGTERPERSAAFCGCGWPQHMLVPRGKHQGMPFFLYVLLSDYELDKVDSGERARSRCGKAVSYCGLLDAKFPDRRPMGYPFDRRAIPSVNNIQDFVGIVPNSRVDQITITTR